MLVLKHLATTALAELAGMGLEQAPGALAGGFFPAGIEGAEFGAESIGFRLVESHALLGEFRTQAVVESLIVGALQLNEFHGVALDHAAGVGRQALPHL